MNLALLNPKVWLELAIVAIVAGAIWFAYHWAYNQGVNATQVKFDAYKTQQLAQAMQSEQDARAKEQAFQVSLENLTNAYITEKTARINDARNAANSLRELQAAIGSPAPINSQTPIGLDDTARARSVVGECAATVQKMAELLDASEGRLKALQAYVKSILEQK